MTRNFSDILFMKETALSPNILETKESNKRGTFSVKNSTIGEVSVAMKHE
jgi:hypothetical protein